MGGIAQTILGFFGFKDMELLYTEGSVLLGMVFNFIPFMILQINTSLCKMDKSLLEASADLGRTESRHSYVSLCHYLYQELSVE